MEEEYAALLENQRLSMKCHLSTSDLLCASQASPLSFEALFKSTNAAISIWEGSGSEHSNSRFKKLF